MDNIEFKNLSGHGEFTEINKHNLEVIKVINTCTSKKNEHIIKEVVKN